MKEVTEEVKWEDKLKTKPRAKAKATVNEEVKQEEDRGAESTPSERGFAPFEVKQADVKPKDRNWPELKEKHIALIVVKK